MKSLKFTETESGLRRKILKLVQKFEPGFVRYIKNGDRQERFKKVLFLILVSSHKNEFMLTECHNAIKLFNYNSSIVRNLKKYAKDQKEISLILNKLKKLGAVIFV